MKQRTPRLLFSLLLGFLTYSNAHAGSRTFRIAWKNKASINAPYKVEVSFKDLRPTTACNAECKTRLAEAVQSGNLALRLWKTGVINGLVTKHILPYKKTISFTTTDHLSFRAARRALFSNSASFIEYEWQEVLAFRAISQSGEVLNLGTNEKLNRSVNFYIFEIEDYSRH